MALNICLWSIILFSLKNLKFARDLKDIFASIVKAYEKGLCHCIFNLPSLVSMYKRGYTKKNEYKKEFDICREKSVEGGKSN